MNIKVFKFKITLELNFLTDNFFKIFLKQQDNKLERRINDQGELTKLDEAINIAQNNLTVEAHKKKNKILLELTKVNEIIKIYSSDDYKKDILKDMEEFYEKKSTEKVDDAKYHRYFNGIDIIRLDVNERFNGFDFNNNIRIRKLINKSIL